MVSIKLTVYTFALLALLGQSEARPTGREDEGCNGEVGISCCYKGFSQGDNNGGQEQFIRADQYNMGCLETCKKLYPESIGITERVNQKYQSGNGKGRNKCWCEFGSPKLERNEEYQTCVFTTRDFLSSLYDLQAQLESAFKTADTDGDGQITKDQLKQVIRSWNGLMTDIQVDAMVDIVMVIADSDEDGKVGESEVVKAVLTDTARSTEAYFAAFFKVFDVDNSGGLNQQELAEVDRRMHGGNYAVQGLLVKDTNGDAEITYQEMKA